MVYVFSSKVCARPNQSGCGLVNHNFPLNSVMEPLLGYSEIVVRLEVDPALSVGAKEPGKPQGGVSGNRTLARNDLADPALGHSNGFGQPILGNPHGLEEIFKQDFTRMNRGHVSFHEYFPSVIINYFDVIGVSILPQKADAPLVTDADAPLALSVSGELLKSVCRRHAEEFKSRGTMELGQFAKCCPL
jgi:hypothetical protein